MSAGGRIWAALIWAAILVAATASSRAKTHEAAPLLDALRRCDVREARLALWNLSGEAAGEVLRLLPELGIEDRRLEAGLLARIGGREAASAGLALLSGAETDPEALLLQADLEGSRHDPSRALDLYHQAEERLPAEAAPELRFHLATRLTELYLSSTPSVERALPHLRRAIGLAYGLGRDEEVRHLQELQQLFALQYSRLKGRPDALRFQPVESHRGLLGSDARALVRQGDGVWVLDSGGAAYFDGVLWKAHASDQMFGYAAILGSDGALYATPLNGGLARLAGGRWTILEEPRGYETNPIHSLLEHAGWLYLGGNQRMARMRLGGGALESVALQPKGPIRKIDVLGDRLIVTSGGGALRQTGETWEALGLGLPEGTTIGNSQTAGEDLWLPTPDGIYRWRDGRLRQYTVADGLPSNELNRILRTEDGRIYATSTIGGALAQFDGEAWQSAPEPIGALDMELVPDSVLVATAAGLYHGRSERWRILDSRSGLPGDQIEYVLKLGEETWLLAQTKGVVRLVAGKATYFGLEDGLPPFANFLAVARQGQQRWLATSVGLFRLEGDHFVEVPIGKDGAQELFSLHAAGPEELLVGTTEGLIALSAGGHVRNIEMPSPVARAIADWGDGRYLVATEGAGLVELRRAEDGSYATVKVWDKASGLCSDQAQAIFTESVDELWVGTDSGLARWRKEGSEEGRWQCLTEADGLPGHDVTAIIRLGSGKLAVAFYLVGVGLHDGRTWSLFGTGDGLPSTVLWSLTEPEPDVLWAGTGQGVWEMRLDARPPVTFVEAQGLLQVRGKEGKPCILGEALASGAASPPTKLRLGLADYVPVEAAPAQGCTDGRPAERLELNEAPELRAYGQSPWAFEDPERLWYSVRVDGGEAGPFQLGSKLRLPELADGMHRIEVVAKNRWLLVDPAPLVLEIDLDRPVPPGILAGLAGAVLLGLYLLRARLRDLILRVRHARYRPIPRNPYLPKSPASGDLLFGREALLERWIAPSRRPDSMSESRLLIGPLSLGKTSLLEEFQRRSFAAGQSAVRMNLAEWMQSDFNALVVALREQLNGGPQTSAENPVRGLDEDLERLGKLEPPRRAYLLLDNFQLLDQLLSLTDTPLQQIVLALRSLLQRHRHLSLILALAGEEEHLKGRYGELFFFSSIDMLGLLPPEATEQLCTRPLAGHVYVTPPAVELIHRLSGGHPGLLQLLMHTLVERLSAAKSNVCNVTFVRAALDGLVGEANLLGGWWQGLTRPQQLVLALAAERVEEGAALDVQAYTEAEANKMGLLAQEARRALLGCVKAMLLEGDEHSVRWSAELFRLWIRAKQPFKSVRERERIQMGPYELLSKVGQGGMGTVYRGRHLTGGEIVAVKVLHAGALEDEESRHRFFREAEIGIRLRHNNIVMIHEKGEHGDQAYLAMEFLEGTTLRGYLRDKGPMGAKAAMKILRAVTDALRAIHELGIIHRDIKTENIFLSTGPTKKTVPKLMDFGLARSEASRVTRTGVIVGTVAYMSPEQALGQKLGPATDLYSMGVVLFEILTAQMPFSGPNDVAILSQVVHRPPPDIRQLRPDIPLGLAELLDALLAKESAARPATAAQVVATVDALLAAGETEPAADEAGRESSRAQTRA